LERELTGTKRNSFKTFNKIRMDVK
jgi:hypothetical protein